MNAIHFYLSFLFCFILFACTSDNKLDKEENKSDIFVSSIGELTFDEMFVIDDEKYAFFCNDEVFRNIAIQYKKNKDEIYNNEEVDYENTLKVLDSIRIEIINYAEKYHCANLISYIDKYAETELVLSRCYFGEDMRKCWERAWNYYENTYEKSIYKRVGDKNAVIGDFIKYLQQGTVRADLVFCNMIANKYNWWQIEHMGGLKSYLNTIGMNVVDDSGVHTINRSLYDSFYWYYLSNRWLDVGGQKSNPNVCDICKCDPCICYTPCPECHEMRIECICCKICGVYPCQCINYVTPEYPGGNANGIFESRLWNDQHLEERINNFILNNKGSNKLFHQLRFTFGELHETWSLRERGKELYPIPVEEEDWAVVHICGYTTMPDEIDLYCFAKAAKKRREIRVAAGYTTDIDNIYVMYIVGLSEVYALVSSGNVDGFLNAIGTPDKPGSGWNPNEVETTGSFIYNMRKYSYKYEYGEEILYQWARTLQAIECDIKIMKLKKGKNGERDEFVKGWYSKYIDNEEDIRK
jgi:hypothetical protein